MILRLHDIGAIKFGNFTLKSGILSPIYIDLRESISFPSLLQSIAEAMWAKTAGKRFDRVCGVPYTALPIASYLSIKYDCPMVMRRKEVKEYGTKKAIEGVFSQNHHCLILEDLITTGASIFETIAPLESVGMKVTDIIVFLDRQQGGGKKVEEKGYHLQSVVKLPHALEVLEDNQRISPEIKRSTLQFLERNSV